MAEDRLLLSRSGRDSEDEEGPASARERRECSGTFPEISYAKDRSNQKQDGANSYQALPWGRCSGPQH